MVRATSAIVIVVLMSAACTGSVEWKVQKITRSLSGDIERVISFTPEDRIHLYIEDARFSAEESEHSDHWRCLLFEAAHHARGIPSDSRWDGPVLAINLERAALAVFWFDANAQIERAFNLADKE